MKNRVCVCKLAPSSVIIFCFLDIWEDFCCLFTQRSKDSFLPSVYFSFSTSFVAFISLHFPRFVDRETPFFLSNFPFTVHPHNHLSLSKSFIHLHPSSSPLFSTLPVDSEYQPPHSFSLHLSVVFTSAFFSSSLPAGYVAWDREKEHNAMAPLATRDVPILRSISSIVAPKLIDLNPRISITLKTRAFDEVDVNKNGQVELGEYLWLISALKSGDVATSVFAAAVELEHQRETGYKQISVERSGGGV
uniref:EF-hand domain-containing protein n=1 Tax=Tetranychus urticae TaxID=32264 RepID=T1KVN6_TETUR